MTEEKLQESLATWQKRLRLLDWQVVLVLRRQYEMPDEVMGECEARLRNKTAVIRLLDPIDYAPDISIPPDIENILVHELLHLHFEPFYQKENDMEQMVQEQAIQALANAFIGLSRENG